MNLTSAPQVKELLARHGLHPKKRLGQNFLIDRNVLNRLLDAANLTAESRVLEIGPGLGVVTLEAAARAGSVVAVEIDRQLDPILQEVLAEHTNVQVTIADFLEIDVCELLGPGKWTVIANLPYYITTPILTRLIETRGRFNSILLMVQREVAQRLRAAPSTEEYGSLTVYLRYYCKIESVMKVSRNVFYPVPDVDSELIKLTVRDKPAVEVSDEALFFNIVRAAFGKRRKTLLNALSSSSELGWDKARAEAILAAADIDAGRRGETLSLDEFAAIANAASTAA